MTRQIDHREQQVADLSGCRCLAGRVGFHLVELGLDLVGFLANFRQHRARIVPVEADASGFLLQLERTG